MKRIFGGTLVLAVLLCATLPAQGPGADDKNKALLAEIEAAWKRQEEAFKEVEIEWKEELFMPKGSQSDLWKTLSESRAKIMNPSGEAIPPRDTKLNSLSKVLLKANNFRYDRYEHFWSPRSRSIELSPIVFYFDKEGSRYIRQAVHDDSADSKHHLSAIIGNKTVCEGARELPCRVVAFALRPLNKAFRLYKFDDLDVVRSTKQDGHDCVECRVSTDNSQASHHVLFLSRTNNFLPIRWAQVHLGVTRVLITAKYEKSESNCFFPSSWSVTNTDRSKRVLESIHCATTMWHEHLNESPTSKLPSGVYVYDLNKPVGQQYYIIQRDGSQRILDQNERFMPYEQLVAKLETESTMRWWIVGAGLLIGSTILLAGLRYWLLGRRKSS
jgi:hypothetical protein